MKKLIIVLCLLAAALYYYPKSVKEVTGFKERRARLEERKKEWENPRVYNTREELQEQLCRELDYKLSLFGEEKMEIPLYAGKKDENGEYIRGFYPEFFCAFCETICEGESSHACKYVSQLDERFDEYWSKFMEHYHIIRIDIK